MDSTETSKKNDLVVTGSKAPVSTEAQLYSKPQEHIKPTAPQGRRMLKSARSTNISYKALHTSPKSASTHLSFSASAFEMPIQYFPISVVLDADLPTVAARKQSVIFSPRKEENHSQNISRLLASKGCSIQKSLSTEDASKSPVLNCSQKTEFHVDAVSAKISPRPPAPAVTRDSPISFRCKPKSPLIARKMAEINPNTPLEGSLYQNTAPELAEAHMRMLSMRMKRRVGECNVGSIDASDLSEDLRKLHGFSEPVAKSFAGPEVTELGQSVASPFAFPEVSQADRVSELEHRVQSAMNRSQFNRDTCHRIVMKTSVGTSNSTLKFAFPHSSTAQLFILPQPMIKLGQSTTVTTLKQTTSRQIAPLNSVPIGENTRPITNSDHSSDSGEILHTFVKQDSSPKQKNTFHVQNDAFTMKSITRSNARTTPYREVQQPILFNQLGPLEQVSLTHERRATEAALSVLKTKPLQVLKTSAEHQKYHIMCNNRVPDFFLAAMHRK